MLPRELMRSGGFERLVPRRTMDPSRIEHAATAVGQPDDAEGNPMLALEVLALVCDLRQQLAADGAGAQDDETDVLVSEVEPRRGPS